MYYEIQGKAVEYSGTLEELRAINEGVQVSEGEEGRSAQLLFLKDELDRVIPRAVL